MPPKTTPNEELKGQSLLVRTVAATLVIRVPSAKEKRFRASLLRKVASEIATMPAGLLIRLFESACDADFPDDDVVEFRGQCEIILAKYLNLAEFKAAPAAPAAKP